MTAFNAFFWMPVFFLYFTSLFSLEKVLVSSAALTMACALFLFGSGFAIFAVAQALLAAGVLDRPWVIGHSGEGILLLEAIYYAAVVLLEVPSGHFSDKFGRRPTLLVSSAALTMACALFLFGSGFAIFAVAQALLAAGVSFNSGTDTSFHFDSLAALGKEAEFAGREARATGYAFTAGAVTAFLGGAVATLELRYAYGLSLLSALATFGIIVATVEPTTRERGVRAWRRPAGINRVSNKTLERGSLVQFRDRHLIPLRLSRRPREGGVSFFLGQASRGAVCDPRTPRLPAGSFSNSVAYQAWRIFVFGGSSPSPS